MYQVNRLVGACCLSLLSFSATAVGDDFIFNVGMDAQMRSMPLKQGGGDNVVKKSYPQGAIYGGIKFNDSFGLELGYQCSVLARRTEKFDSNGTSYFNAGLVIDPNDHYISRSTVSTQGFYTGVLGFLPISEAYRLKFVASVGMVRMKTKIASTLDFFDALINTTAVDDVQNNFVQTKWIPKVSAGVQHMINDHFGVRALAGWEQTLKFKHIAGVSLQTGLPERFSRFARLKNSTTLGLGVFYDF